MVRALFLGCLLVLLAGLLIPDEGRIPVVGATERDWNRYSFWFEPWGASGVHKGIDIFGPMGAAVVSATPGLVVYAGEIGRGGKVVLVLGPKWRLHYYAHLRSLDTSILTPLAAGDPVGTLGDSGNAKGKPPHLHYSIVRLIPAIWAIDDSTQGYKKAFYIDPDAYLRTRG